MEEAHHTTIHMLLMAISDLMMWLAITSLGNLFNLVGLISVMILTIATWIEGVLFSKYFSGDLFDVLFGICKFSFSLTCPNHASRSIYHGKSPIKLQFASEIQIDNIGSYTYFVFLSFLLFGKIYKQESLWKVISFLFFHHYISSIFLSLRIWLRSLS